MEPTTFIIMIESEKSSSEIDDKYLNCQMTQVFETWKQIHIIQQN